MPLLQPFIEPLRGTAALAGGVMESDLVRNDERRDGIALACVIFVLSNDLVFLLIGMLLGMLMP